MSNNSQFIKGSGDSEKKQTQGSVTQTNQSNSAKQQFQSAAQERLVLTNRGAHTLTVPIYNPETGEKDFVFSQPGGKPKLKEGWVVDNVYVVRHPELVARKI